MTARFDQAINIMRLRVICPCWSVDDAAAAEVRAFLQERVAAGRWVNEEDPKPEWDKEEAFRDF